MACWDGWSVWKVLEWVSWWRCDMWQAFGCLEFGPLASLDKKNRQKLFLKPLHKNSFLLHARSFLHKQFSTQPIKHEHQMKRSSHGEDHKMKKKHLKPLSHYQTIANAATHSKPNEHHQNHTKTPKPLERTPSTT